MSFSLSLFRKELYIRATRSLLLSSTIRGGIRTTLSQKISPFTTSQQNNNNKENSNNNNNDNDNERIASETGASEGTDASTTEVDPKDKQITELRVSN